MTMFGVNFTLLVFIVYTSGLQECDRCPQGSNVCINIKKCKSMESKMINTTDDKICGVDGTEQLVCCDNTPYTDAQTYDTDYVTSVHPAPKDDEMSKSMCKEYHRQVNNACMRGTSPYNEYSRVKCRLTIDEVSEITVDAAPGEYPHVALVGKGPRDAVNWVCSGTIVSDRYVLTAAHCANQLLPDNTTYVKVGTTRIDDDNAVYAVSRVMLHPDYIHSTRYNDIALLQVDKYIAFNAFTIPACLHTGETIQDDVVSSAGWKRGLDNMINVMQKITRRKIPNTECRDFFKPRRQIPQGINLTTQICYSYNYNENNCDGYLTSGSPLQVKSDNYCTWTVTGFITFGPNCGKFDVYTRVAPFVPWIESVVWA